MLHHGTASGRGIKWDRFEAESARFVQFATSEVQVERHWRAWSADPKRGNCPKVLQCLRGLLERLASEEQWGTPSMEWLIAVDDDTFDTVYTSHAEWRSSSGRVGPSAVAQSMRNLKRPLEWACDQDWPWEGETWRVSYDEKRWVMDKLENLCSQLATVATKRKAHEASMVARESMSLEEYHEAIEADVKADLHKLKLVQNDDAIPPDVMLHALETLILSLHTRGCRPLEFYDLHYAENRLSTCHTRHHAMC